MRRKFNSNLLPTTWKAIPSESHFCPIRFGEWILATQRYHKVNTVMMEDWGFNSQTLTRWRRQRQKKRPTHGAILKFCAGIRDLSIRRVIIENLIEEANEHMKQQ
jgi:hypothetical protein